MLNDGWASRVTPLAFFLVTSASLISCGGGGGGSTPAANVYSVGGTVNGLSGDLVLRNTNTTSGSSEDYTVSGSSFTFPTALPDLNQYSVAVVIDPVGQTCTVSANGSGKIAGANVADVTVSCDTNRYAIRGNVSGLAGNGLVLRLDRPDVSGVEDLAISTDGPFAFMNTVLSGVDYDVSINHQPSYLSQFCELINGHGTVLGNDISDINVTCTTNAFTVGGTLTGLSDGNSIVLQNERNGETLTLTANDGFVFGQTVLSGDDFSIVVNTQPDMPAQVCEVSNGVGTVTSGQVTYVNVDCLDTYAVSVNVSGLAVGNTMTLQNKWGDNLTVDTLGPHTFTTRIADGQDYFVSILSQPQATAQSCEINNRSGVINSADVDDITITCGPLQSAVYSKVVEFGGGGYTTDLYLIKEDGSGLETISDSATELEYWEPGHVSADGKIIFSRIDGIFDHDIYSFTPGDVTPQPIVATAQDEVLVAVTVSGRIIFNRTSTSGDTDVYSVYSDGSNGRLLLQTAEDDQAVGVTASGRVVMQRSLAGGDDIYTVNETGSDLIQVTNTTQDEQYLASYGDYIIYKRLSTNGFWHIFSRHARALESEVIYGGGDYNYTYYAVTDNGKAIFKNGLTGKLYFLAVDGSAPGNSLVTGTTEERFNARYSTDRLIITKDDGVQTDLFIVNDDGSNEIALGSSGEDETYGGQTRDGRILFMRGIYGQRDVYIVNADGTNEIRLTRATAVDQATNAAILNLTPDGKIIFTRTNSAGTHTLYSINHDGTGSTTALNLGDAELVAITRGGRVIFEFTSNPTSDVDISSRRSDGSDLQPLADSLSDERFSGLYDE